MDITSWLKQNLEEILTCEVTEDMLYCLTKMTDDELDGYMSNFTDITNPDYKNFMKSYKVIRSLADSPSGVNGNGFDNGCSNSTNEYRKANNLTKKSSKKEISNMEAKNVRHTALSRAKNTESMMNSNKVDISQWLKENLQEILTCLVTDDIVQYIMSIEDDRDLQEYMSTFTVTSDPKYKNFISNYKKIKSILCNKDDEDDGYDYNVKSKDCDKRNRKGNDVHFKDKKSNYGPDVKDNNEKHTGQKKKTKYVNLYSAEGKQKDVILLKGRHLCECQASKHKLINNCMKCGRIICEQEGTGPCLFCGMMVFSKEEQARINSNTKQSRKLYNTIMESIELEGLDKALERRDKLLEYDRTSAQRTKVIDDEGDYFSSNSVWLSKEERERLKKKEEEAHARKHASRLEKKFTLDFAGRTVVEDDPEQFDQEYYAQALNMVESVLDERYTHPDAHEFVELLYECSKATSVGRQPNFTRQDSKHGNYRVQDREILEMTDNGVCLSLHQPWASLLVHGIMRYEGRSWYTSHRGRLWIAAASKHPIENEIKEAERFFREVRAGEDLKFPRSYPTSCLLGCVSVTDCLPQEEFRARFPDGECDSPFVFICEDPRPLDTLFPVSGSHKIYKLDPKIHLAAVKILLRMAKNAGDQSHMGHEEDDN